jgi:hypothetical protein
MACTDRLLSVADLVAVWERGEGEGERAASMEEYSEDGTDIGKASAKTP